MTMDLRFRFGYREVIPWVRMIDGVLKAVSGPDQLSLHTPVTLMGKGPATTASFDVEAGECVPFVLVWSQSYEDTPALPTRSKSSRRLSGTAGNGLPSITTPSSTARSSCAPF
jgi:hypothetical protein